MKAHTSPTGPQSSGPGAQAEPVSILSYSSQAASLRNRITLEQNLFSFLLEGEKTVHYPGRTARINPDQFLLLSAGNCLMSEKTAPQGSRYQSILVFFDNQVLADFLQRYPEALKIRVATMAEHPFLLFEKDVYLRHFIESLGHMLAASQPIPANMRLVKLHELLLYLCENYPGQLQKLRNMEQPTADEMLIRQAVTAHMDHPVTVEELAFLCHTSLSTFKRRFARIYGSSPNKWLLEKRMQKAARLLRQGDHKASEIYYELGYENLSSFIQSFKQVYGVTPKQYQLLN